MQRKESNCNDVMEGSNVLYAKIDKEDKTNFPILSQNELTQLWKLVANNPDKTIFKNAISNFTVFKFDGLYVVSGKIIGKGFWGIVSFATQYEKNATEPFAYCVVKTLKEKNIFGKWLDRTLDTNKKLIKESTLTAKIHPNQSSSLIVNEDNVNKTYIMLPYLGKISLSSMLKKSTIIPLISCEEWLKLFITLVNKLKSFHQILNRLHNDIKPENIGITLEDHGNQFSFREINFFDLGNTQVVNKTGSFGDPRYQPMMQCVPGLLFPNLKNTTVDIYALGKSLLEVTSILLKNKQNAISDQKAYVECQNLFEMMCATIAKKRPALKICAEKLEKIALEYQIASTKTTKSNL